MDKCLVWFTENTGYIRIASIIIIRGESIGDNFLFLTEQLLCRTTDFPLFAIFTGQIAANKTIPGCG